MMTCWSQRKRAYKEIWLICLEDISKIEDFVTILSDRNATMDYDDDFIVGLNKTDHIELWELYRIGNGSPIEYVKIGKWSLDKRLQFTELQKWQRRGNLKLHHFNFTALPETPFMISIELDSFSGKYEIVGSFADLINLYANTMNFTYTLKPPPDGAWGGKQEDGSWNGMMKLVQEQKVDIGKMCYQSQNLVLIMLIFQQLHLCSKPEKGKKTHHSAYL